MQIQMLRSIQEMYPGATLLEEIVAEESKKRAGGADRITFRLLQFCEAIRAVTAAGLAAPAAAQVVGLGEDQVGAFVVELVRLWGGGGATLWSGCGF